MMTQGIYQRPALHEHLIRSNRVDEVFKIKVLLPFRCAGDQFPVIYASDADEFFGGYADLASCLQLRGECQRFILVGIGYQNTPAAQVLRLRDFHSHSTRQLYVADLKQLASSSVVAGVPHIESITQTTDASDFLSFLSDELMSFVAERYPISGDHGYCGYSAGGGFGLHTLFTRPETFDRYILGSPTTSHNGVHFAIALAEAFRRSAQTMRTKVFASVGNLEEFDRGLGKFDLVTGLYLFAKHLKKSPIPGLDLTVRTFPNETHASAWALAFSHGVRALYPSTETPPFWPEYLKSG
jgi:predicted alpha/beta superfamily hydrolase